MDSEMGLSGKTVLVVGTGISGIAAVNLLATQSANIILLDGNTELSPETVAAKFSEDIHYDLILGDLPDQVMDRIDLAVLSPGVPTDLPFVVRMQEAGIPIWGEIELAYVCGKGKVVAITGTNGKTTTTAKLAGKFKLKGKKPLLVACDVYRPAAIKQLQINGEKQGVEVFSMGENHKPANIAKAALEHAAKNGNNLVILDTAGRLHVDEDMMAELQEIKESVEVHQTILVVDAMTGQDAVNVAQSFNEKIGLDGVILTKLDGDTRGGAALSIRAVTGQPILYVGMGEKLSDLEQFYPDRMASRILGMGDVLTLIEKVGAEIDEDKAKEMSQKIKKAQFDFDDYLESMKQMKKMGGLSSILGMMPGLNASQLNQIDSEEGQKKMAQMEAMILSMTPKERRNPEILNPSRKHRIAQGAGVNIADVNRMVKQFEQSRKMMKQLPGMMGGKFGKKGKFKLPF